MDKPTQWMTLPELRAELEATAPAWRAHLERVGADRFALDLDSMSGPVPGPVRRHAQVQQELLRRPSTAAP